MDIKINEHLNFASGFELIQTDSEEYSNQMNVISRGLAAPPTQKKYNDDGTPTKGYNATSQNPIWYKYYNDQSTVDKRLSAYETSLSNHRWTLRPMCNYLPTTITPKMIVL